MWEFFEWSHPSDGWPDATGALKPRKDEFGILRGVPFLWLSLSFPSPSPSLRVFFERTWASILSLCWRDKFCVFRAMPFRTSHVKLSVCLERGRSVTRFFLGYHGSVARTQSHTQTWLKEYVQVLWNLCSLAPAACLFKAFLVSLLCPYVLIQLCSNQDRLVIYRGPGLRFGTQLQAQQRDHHCHVYTSSCSLIHMQRLLAAHTYRPNLLWLEMSLKNSPLLSFPSSATCVYSRLPDLQTGLEAITELFTLQSP